MTDFRIKYRCPECGEEWQGTWECVVDDDCPACGTRHIQATDYEEVRNTNILAGWCCPDCNSIDRFAVVTETISTLEDNGVMETTDAVFDWDSWARCDSCDFEGPVGAFSEGELEKQHRGFVRPFFLALKRAYRQFKETRDFIERIQTAKGAQS